MRGEPLELGVRVLLVVRMAVLLLGIVIRVMPLFAALRVIRRRCIVMPIALLFLLMVIVAELIITTIIIAAVRLQVRQWLVWQ
jgi:hypothetical protein